MDNKLTCSTCQHWAGKPCQFVADCALGVYYGRPTFDYQGCAYHSERGKTEEGVAMQSAARGMTYQEWQRRVTGK